MGRNDQQQNRNDDGRYRDGPKCEVCGKPTGFEYFSDHRLDTSREWGGLGLVLCKRCAERLAKLPDAEAFAILTGKA